MGWERRNGKRYYYHTYHFRGKKRRLYFGPHGDPVAELAAVNAALDQLNRELDERAYANEVTRLRLGPIVAGINAATDCLGRMRTGQTAASDSPKPGSDGSETA